MPLPPSPLRSQGNWLESNMALGGNRPRAKSQPCHLPALWLCKDEPFELQFPYLKKVGSTVATTGCLGVSSQIGKLIQQMLVPSPSLAPPSPILCLCSNTPSRSVLSSSSRDCLVLPAHTVVSLPETWFYLEKNKIPQTRVYGNFWKITEMQFETGVFRVDFSHEKKKPGKLVFKLIAMLINFSKTQLNLPLSFHSILHMINTQHNQ